MSDNNISQFPNKRVGRPQSGRPDEYDFDYIEYLCRRVDLTDPKQTESVRFNFKGPLWLRTLLTQVATDSASTTKGVILDALEKRGFPTTTEQLQHYQK